MVEKRESNSELSKMDGKLIRMPALGRHFKLGDLYDYRTDRNLTGKTTLFQFDIKHSFGELEAFYYVIKRLLRYCKYYGKVFLF